MPSEDRLSRAERELFLRSFVRDGIGPGSAAVRALSDAMTEGYYPTGSVLYQRGSMPRFVYYVVSGRVRLSADGHAPLDYDKLSAIGGLDALQDIPYTRTAVALADTRTLLLPVTKYLQVIEDNFEFAKRMVTFMVGQIDALGAQLAVREVYGRAGATTPDVSAPSDDRRLGLLERMLVVRQAPLFGGLRSQVLVGLAERLEERTLDAAETLYGNGNDATAFWFVASGDVTATRAGETTGHGFRAGDVLLLYAAFADLEANYRVVAARRSRLLRLRKDDFFDLLEDHGDVGRVALGFAAGQRTRLVGQLADHGMKAPPISQFAVGRR